MNRFIVVSSLCPVKQAVFSLSISTYHPFLFLNKIICILIISIQIILTYYDKIYNGGKSDFENNKRGFVSVC